MWRRCVGDDAAILLALGRLVRPLWHRRRRTGPEPVGSSRTLKCWWTLPVPTPTRPQQSGPSWDSGPIATGEQPDPRERRTSPPSVRSSASRPAASGPAATLPLPSFGRRESSSNRHSVFFRQRQSILDSTRATYEMSFRGSVGRYVDVEFCLEDAFFLCQSGNVEEEVVAIDLTCEVKR